MKAKRVTTLKLSDHELDIIKNALEVAAAVVDEADLQWDKHHYQRMLNELGNM